MTPPIAVLRPEPGNAATVAAVRAAGRHAIALPLFKVVPLDWHGPDPGDHDALVLTSANAVRQAAGDLARYAALPVHAVGTATAAVARAAGLRVVAIGDSDGRALLDAAQAAGVRAALLLTTHDRAVAAHPAVTAIRAVYASVTIDPVDAGRLAGAVALVHSRRAAERLAQIADDRGSIAVAAISAAVAAALGSGWRAVSVAARPNDAAVCAAGIALADALARD